MVESDSTPLARFAAAHGIKPQQIADATGKTLSHACYLLSGERQPSKEVIDQLLAYCRSFDSKVTYDRLFGEYTFTRPLRTRAAGDSR